MLFTPETIDARVAAIGKIVQVSEALQDSYIQVVKNAGNDANNKLESMLNAAQKAVGSSREKVMKDLILVYTDHVVEEYKEAEKALSTEMMKIGTSRGPIFSDNPFADTGHWLNDLYQAKKSGPVISYMYGVLLASHDLLYMVKEIEDSTALQNKLDNPRKFLLHYITEYSGPIWTAKSCARLNRKGEKFLCDTLLDANKKLHTEFKDGLDKWKTLDDFSETVEKGIKEVRRLTKYSRNSKGQWADESLKDFVYSLQVSAGYWAGQISWLYALRNVV